VEGVSGLLLAAGAGTRLGRPKALVELGGRRLVERGVDMLRAAGCAPVVVVLGAAADHVLDTVDLGDAPVMVNPDWAGGIGSSLRVGLAAQPADVRAVVVALADQPLIGRAAISRLAAAWRAGAVAAVATYGGEARNPVLLDRSVWADVGAAAIGDKGARALLRNHLEQVTPVPCDGTGSPFDLDTPADLATLKALVQAGFGG
jgi:CTP:molybdopterin cytidylyltransferase MocA